jgi:hypothetical protein
MFEQPTSKEATANSLWRWWLEPLADLVFGFAVSATFLGIVSLALGEQPRVQFDTAYLVACREVTSPTFGAANPGQRLIEARIEVSSLIAAGSETDIAQHIYRFDGVQGTLQVHDYAPKTTLDTRYAGPIAMKSNDDEGATLNINLLGKYEALTGAAITADWKKQHNRHAEYSLLPPLEAVAASGTLNRGRSAFFKLRGNERTWLEGSKEFGLILAVPQGWQADYLRVRCEAEGVRHANGQDEKFSCGQRDFLVGLFLEGDEFARAAAFQLVAAEAQLRQQAASLRTRQERASKEHPLGLLAVAFGVRERKPADDWLPRVTWSSEDNASMLARLPKEVRPAAERYRSAQQEVARLAGSGRSL